MDNIEFIVPRAFTQVQLKELPSLVPLSVFDTDVIAFLAFLSQSLMNNPGAKAHPEIVALGFWLRPTNLKNLAALAPKRLLKPVGTVVHFTPANVDTMFVYSWVCSLLMGNHNIVRVSSAEQETKSMLLNILDDALNQTEFASVARRNVFIKYSKYSDVSKQLSLLCDARVLWGGDESVNTIRSYPTKPRCRDIGFSDRYSAVLINGNALQSGQQINDLAKLIWRDTQPYYQHACSSPKVMLWHGSVENQLALFQEVNILAAQDGVSIQHKNTHLVTSQLIQSSGKTKIPLIAETICVVAMTSVDNSDLEIHPGEGYFYLTAIDSLDEIAHVATEKLQTISYFGFSKVELLKLIENPSINGIDRVVPVGRALDFFPIWDGYDIFSQLSRQVVVE
jgi:hypothetical protein